MNLKENGPIKNEDGYWISPKGKSIPAGLRHIQIVIDKPTSFGLTDEYIKKIYAKHNEPMNVGGLAREEIMKNMMKKGWIRVRYYGKQDRWQFQTYYFGKREKDNIWGFLSDGLAKGIVSKFSSVDVLIIKTQRIAKGSVGKSSELFESLLKESLNESGLSRMFLKNREHDCGSITAFRTGENCGNGEKYNRSEKLKRNKSLLAKLLSHGYGVTRLYGKYPEGGKIGKEISFFVVDTNNDGNLLSDLRKLGEEFEQDSILFIPKGTVDKKDKAFLIGTNHCENNFLSYGERQLFNKGRFGVESKIYTSYVNGRPFIFEEVGKDVTPPASGKGIWAMNIISEMHWKDI